MIYIATHKVFNNPQIDNYIPLQVGAEGKKNLGYLRDNSGNNISKKNPNFCELTGLYWIWKNCSDDYKGLVHYRRYFGKSNWSNKFNDIYSYNEMLDLLKNVDIVLPYIECFKQNAKEEILRECCTMDVFSKLEQIISAKYPMYRDSFENYFAQNKTTLFNMMFCKAEIFDQYCEWLFDILFELEKKVDLSLLNPYQQRLYGFLSERLLNIWVDYHNLSIKNVSVINTEMDFRHRVSLIRKRVTNEVFWRINRE